MDFGIALAPGVDAWKAVVRAEQLGFSHTWLYDTQMWVRPEEARFVTPELLRTSTFTGTVEELVDRVHALRDAGYHQLAVQLVPGHEAAMEDWVRVFERV